MTEDPREILFELAARVVAAIVDRLGREPIETIFVSGGAARNEIASYRTTCGLEIYSDLDVFVLLRDDAGLDTARRAARGAALNLPREGRGHRILPPPDIGVFTKSDFLAQKARPGTVEIRENHAVLYGASEISLEALPFDPTGIDPSEGLYLLENRLAEIAVVRGEAERDGTDAFRRYLRYVLLKSCADAAAAVLIAVGLFHPARDERWKRFRAARERGDLRQLLSDASAERIDRSFGELSRLQETFEAGVDADKSAGREEEAMLLDVWKRIAGWIAPEAPGDWAGLVEWRCKVGRWAANARELSALARRSSVPRARVLLRSGRLARLSPVDALRLWGLASALENCDSSPGAPHAREALEGRFFPVLEDITKTFRYTSGSVLERARRMFEETA